jgi:hypothetical protein
MGMKKIRCKIKVLIVALDTSNVEGPWRVQYCKNGGERVYNYLPDKAISLPLFQRCFHSSAHHQSINKLHNAGIEPSKILAVLQGKYSTKEALIIRKDV